MTKIEEVIIGIVVRGFNNVKLYLGDSVRINSYLNGVKVFVFGICMLMGVFTPVRLISASDSLQVVESASFAVLQAVGVVSVLYIGVYIIFKPAAFHATWSARGPQGPRIINMDPIPPSPVRGVVIEEGPVYIESDPIPIRTARIAGTPPNSPHVPRPSENAAYPWDGLPEREVYSAPTQRLTPEMIEDSAPPVVPPVRKQRVTKSKLTADDLLPDIPPTPIRRGRPPTKRADEPIVLNGVKRDS